MEVNYLQKLRDQLLKDTKNFNETQRVINELKNKNYNLEQGVTRQETIHIDAGISYWPFDDIDVVIGHATGTCGKASIENFLKSAGRNNITEEDAYDYMPKDTSFNLTEVHQSILTAIGQERMTELNNSDEYDYHNKLDTVLYNDFLKKVGNKVGSDEFSYFTKDEINNFKTNLAGQVGGTTPNELSDALNHWGVNSYRTYNNNDSFFDKLANEAANGKGIVLSSIDHDYTIGGVFTNAQTGEIEKLLVISSGTNKGYNLWSKEELEKILNGNGYATISQNRIISIPLVINNPNHLVVIRPYIKPEDLLELATNIIKSILGFFNMAKKTISPIILDLNCDGVKTISITNGVKFDHDNNGFAEQTGWVDSNDGLLVLDKNSNGKIDNGTELFGENTILSNGKKGKGGFETQAA